MKSGRRGFRPAGCGASVSQWTCVLLRGRGRTWIGDTPDKFDDSSAAGALGALLHDLLGCREGIRDAAAASHEHGAGEAMDDGMPWATCAMEQLSKHCTQCSRILMRRTKGTGEHNLNAAAPEGTLADIDVLGEVKEAGRPIARLLHHQDQALLARVLYRRSVQAIIHVQSFTHFAHTGDRERVRFGPPEDAHTKREHAQTDMLARTPPRIHTGHLNAGRAELGDRVQVRCDDARLESAEKTVEAVHADADVDVGKGPWLVVDRLRTSRQAIRQCTRLKRVAHSDEDADGRDYVGDVEKVVVCLAQLAERKKPEYVHEPECDAAPDDVQLHLLRDAPGLGPLGDCKRGNEHN